MSIEIESKINTAVDIINSATAILITSGAGMGVDSGLPDYRSKNGFWKAHPILEDLKLTFSMISNPRLFHSEPELLWGVYAYKYNLYSKTIPNDSFSILKKIGESKRDGYFAFTSNIDGQFTKAGYNEENILEQHGSIHYLQCLDACTDEIWPTTNIELNINEDTLRLSSPLPLCPKCGALARPNILMFDDTSWIINRRKKQEINLQQWMPFHNNIAIIEIGAGTALQTIRHMSESGIGNLIRINPNEFEIPNNVKGVGIPLRGLDAISLIYEKYQNRNN
ncbi:MAG: Sir2 family NAD-dependent protein deacetylase [Methylococcales bacterium]